jgi:DNA-binding CsgD family transcriptional regulator
MIKRIVLYGIVLAVVTICLQLLQYKLVIINHSLELYGLAIALVFTVTGAWAGWKLTRKKQTEVIVEKTVYLPGRSNNDFQTNEPMLEKLGISKREHEILSLIAKGSSNQEIANELFLSVNTVKTHTSNLFMKLDVNRRTQAVQKGKELSLIP